MDDSGHEERRKGSRRQGSKKRLLDDRRAGPGRVAGSGPAEPRRRRSMWRGAKANGGQATPGAAGRCGERRSAVRVIGASIEELLFLNCVSPAHVLLIIPPDTYS